MTFDDILDIILPLFQVSIQDFADTRPPKNASEMYELLLKNSNRYDTNRREFSGNQEQRIYPGNGGQAFLHVLRSEKIEMVLMGKIMSLNVVSIVIIEIR